MSDNYTGEKVYVSGTLTNASNLYEAESQPNLVLRRPVPTHILTEERVMIDRDKRFTELVIDLEEKFGIKSPKIQMAKVQNSFDGSENTYLCAEKIYGKNLWDGREDIEPRILERAIKSILEYFQSVLENKGDYLSDLTPINIIYGHTASDHEAQLYFIDIDSHFWSRLDQDSTGLDPNVEVRVLPQVGALLRFGIGRGEKWGYLEEQLQQLPTHP